jgi:hypothetical protein
MQMSAKVQAETVFASILLAWHEVLGKKQLEHRTRPTVALYDSGEAAEDDVHFLSQESSRHYD